MNDKESILKRVKTEYILKYLSEYSDSEHCVNSNAIISYLAENGINCARKSIYDDISALNLFGYDISRGASSNDGYFLAERPFETSEIRLMIDAVTSAPFITEKKTNELIEKLLGFLSVYQQEVISSQLSKSKRVKFSNEQIYYVIDEINRAISEKKRIEFDYYKYIINDNKPILTKQRRFEISPYALVWANDKYYLVGNYDKYDNLSNYRIDRIKMIDITDKDARPYSELSKSDEEFDASDYVKKNIMMYNGEEVEIELVCSNEILDLMIDRFGSDTMIVNKMKNRFYIKTTVFFSDGLIDWLFQYCDRLKILSPKILEQKIIEKAEATINFLKS